MRVVNDRRYRAWNRCAITFREKVGLFEIKTVVDRSLHNANRSIVVSGTPISVIARRQRP